MVRIFAFTAALLLVLAGCAQPRGTEYDGRSYDRIKEVETGTVVDHRYVIVSDDGTGRFLGALVGAVLGSTMGGGEGRRLALVGGGILGGGIGSEAGKANAEELTVELDRGGTVVVVVKGDSGFLVGDRVRIIEDGVRAATVRRIPNE